MAPVIADNRSLGCNGVGVTTGAIRLAARSMSAPDSENSGELLGLWLSSADTGQWCHAALSQWLAARAHRGQHEHRNLAVRLGLVAGIVRPDRHGALPPDGLRHRTPRGRRSRRSRCRPAARPVGSSRRCGTRPDFRRPTQRGDDRVLAVVLDAHQRGLTEFAGLRPDGGEQDDRLSCSCVPSVPPDFIYVSACSRDQSSGLGAYSPESGIHHLNGG